MCSMLRRNHAADPDFIIACDCLNLIYTRASYEALATTIRRLAGPETRIAIGYEQRGLRIAAKCDPLHDDVFGNFYAHLSNEYGIQLVRTHGDMHVFVLRKLTTRDKGDQQPPISQ